MNRIELIELQKLIFDVYGIKEVNLDTVLNKKKTLSEDNDTFFNILKQKYGLDTNDFNYYDYYYEDQFILVNLIRSSFRYLGLTKNKKKNLTVRYLLDSINNGKIV